MKSILITGGSRGIGAATALLAAKEGYAVIVNYYRNKNAADTIVSKIKNEGGAAIAIQADITKEQDVARLFNESKRVFGNLEETRQKKLLKPYCGSHRKDLLIVPVSLLMSAGGNNYANQHIMKLFFKELFEYNHHFNQKLSEVFVEKHDTISERSVKLFSHILNAHHIWNSRIIGKQNAFNVWDIHPAEQFREIDDKNFNETVLALNQVDLNNIILYKTTKGQAFENKTSDILFHIINHSTYHRGQIAADFRQTGTEPLSTDYIFYKR